VQELEAMRVGYHFDPLYLEHLTGPGHVERPERLESVIRHVAASALNLAEFPARHSDGEEWIAAVHDQGYLEAVRRACERAPAAGLRLDPDTAVTHESFRVAVGAVQAALTAVDLIEAGECQSAFAAVRPPGHHAEYDRAMGFCLFNTIAVAARYAQRTHQRERILIVDWDVHHGNGTQHLFEEDPSVFYFSVHQFPLYPGTGRREERGHGAGAGTTLNVPVPPGSGDAEFQDALTKELAPAAAQFKPDLILISAGFDAHQLDPLAQCRVSSGAYRRMARTVKAVAQQHCDGKLIALLEGGYHLEALGESVVECLRGLGAPATDDPVGQ
jgi:acetoin utilization deacetylase AcuC-like enzyme